MGFEHTGRVLEIQHECYTEVAPESPQSIAAKCEASPSSCFVASIEGRIIAYLLSFPSRFDSPPSLDAAECRIPKHPDTLYLHDLAISLEARGSGVGTPLVAAAFAAARGASLSRACLIAVQNSQRYWERFGFQVVPELPPGVAGKLASYGPGARYMQRDL